MQKRQFRTVSYVRQYVGEFKAQNAKYRCRFRTLNFKQNMYSYEISFMSQECLQLQTGCSPVVFEELGGQGVHPPFLAFPEALGSESLKKLSNYAIIAFSLIIRT